LSAATRKGEKMENRRGLKLGNEYAHAMGRMYADTPKAVFAAVAYSLAMRLEEDNPERAVALLKSEWRALYVIGIVPQKP
jgi:hypothetical protein